MKKRTKIFAIGGLAAAAAVGGTFAYYNATQTFSNPFDTTNFGTQATEKFNPSDGHEWKPGAEVDKKVTATNTGDGTVWVRVKFDEKWLRGGSEFILISSGDEEFNAENGATGHQTNPTDGLTTDDGSVVYKKFADDLSTNWHIGDDGYYYYKKELKKNESTAALLESVKLCGDTDMGKFDEHVYYLKAEKDSLTEMPVYSATDTRWTTEDLLTAAKNEPEKYKDFDIYTYKDKVLDTGAQGYSNADYNLDITVEFVQADEEAAQAFPEEAKWAWWPGKDAAAGTN